MKNNATQTGPSNDDVNALLSSIEAVKRLLAAGLLDAKSLGLPAAPADEPLNGGLPMWAIVPGEAITVRELVAKTKAGLKPSTLRAYRCYLDLLADGYQVEDLVYPGIGDRMVHEVLASDLRQALAFVKERALRTAHLRAELRESVNRAVRDSTGAGAQSNAVAAWRCAFKVAVDDRHLAKAFNPAHDVEKPRRSSGSRRPLRSEHMQDFWAVVKGTGNDPELDELLCQTILITGARREGLTNLNLRGIDRGECTVRLDEKFDKIAYQPVPDWFVERLWTFAVTRGAAKPTDQVFRLALRSDGTVGTPITSRRLDNLFQRVQSILAWADKQQVTAHTLRHHAVGLVERHAGKQVAAEFARHEPGDTSDLYGRASREEVAQAVVDLHGGHHPWLNPPAAN